MNLSQKGKSFLFHLCLYQQIHLEKSEKMIDRGLRMFFSFSTIFFYYKKGSSRYLF